jgi:hypothetical protein
MSKSTLAMVLFIVAAILGVVAAFVDSTRGVLTPLAIAATALGLAVEAS